LIGSKRALSAGGEELFMKGRTVLGPALITALVLAFISIPALGTPVSVGGDFGRSWLAGLPEEEPVVIINNSVTANSTNATNGTTSAPAAATDKGLWSWGSIPKGQEWVDGKLVQIGNAMLISPAFPEDNGVIRLGFNQSRNITDAFSPEEAGDPWMVSQTTGRPVLVPT